MATEKKSITVDGIEYVPKGSLQPSNSKIKIVILQRGWVVVGRWSKKGDDCSLDDASVIRSWGTSNGIGQLALEGPQTNTKLDPVGHVDFHILTTVAVINCNEAKWKTEL